MATLGAYHVVSLAVYMNLNKKSAKQEITL